MARVKRALAVLPDNAAADIADDDVLSHVVVRVADEVVVDLNADLLDGKSGGTYMQQRK